ncbi:MAG: hypothetical protein MUF00_02960 [Gemmatimonadaceae bacterium]|jgi:hypothetical protein|nr:hypothetical protein [Gemmatimonadaceae bacterium]
MSSSPFLDRDYGSRLALITLFSLFIMYFGPIADLLVQAWPIQVSNIQWRAGAALGGVQTLPVQFFALSLIIGLGVHLDKRALVRVMSVWAMLVAVAAIGVMVVFGLDALQLRRAVAAAMQSRFDKTAVRAVAYTVIIAPALIALGLTGLKLASGNAVLRGRPASGRPASDNDQSKLIFGVSQ